MGPLVDIVIEDARWEDLGLSVLADRAARAALADRGLPEKGFSLCLMGCDDARIADLNADFRGKPQPTNVLSWPSGERGARIDGERPDAPCPGTSLDPEELGDIAIAWETCAAEAEAGGKPMPDHVAHLVIHGVLHLLGYDHVRNGDAELMEGIESRILEGLGIADPYQ
ncbi:MAG: rRNA maturation RNase YbeY [Pseudorhodobacter sp.]